MSKMIVKALSLLAVVTLASVTAVAQGEGDQKPCCQKCPARSALSQVGLSAEQQTQVDALFAEAKAQCPKAKGECPKGGQVKGECPKGGQAKGGCPKGHGPGHGPGAEQHKQMCEKLQSILTAEQYAKFQELMKSHCPQGGGQGHGAHHGQGHCGGHHGGHGGQAAEE